MFVAKAHFLSEIVNEYDKHPVPLMTVLDIPQDCRFLKLKHHLHSWEKNDIEKNDAIWEG